MVRAVINVATREREDVMRYALQLFKPDMPADIKITLIGYVADVSADQRADYVQQRRELELTRH